MTTKTIQLPKWSSWDIEVFTRVRNGVKEFAYYASEVKWHELTFEGDYELIPTGEEELLAPFFNPKGTKSEEGNFIVKGNIVDEMQDGGYVDVNFPISQEYLWDEFNKVQKETGNCCEREIMTEMGFGEDCAYDGDECFIVVQGGAL